MDNTIFQLIKANTVKQELTKINGLNKQSIHFGLCLSQDECQQLITTRNKSLKEYQRFEFRSSILDKLIYTFMDSPYLNQDNYADTLCELIDLFYAFKNSSLDIISDDELLNFLKQQFDTISYGDIDYLRSTCLPRFSEAITKGYREFIENKGFVSENLISHEQRWDFELFYEQLKELFW